jgi:hypothetical protein
MGRLPASSLTCAGAVGKLVSLTERLGGGCLERFAKVGPFSLIRLNVSTDTADKGRKVIAAFKFRCSHLGRGRVQKHGPPISYENWTPHAFSDLEIGYSERPASRW